MDRISQLHDSLLLRILSELPNANEVLATMVLSKRWQPLWKSVPKLVYDDNYRKTDSGKFSRFVFSSLILHKAHVETLDFKITQNSDAGDIGLWIAFATKIGVRDLSFDIDCDSSKTSVILPRSLYTGFGMLVTLKLKSVTLMDVSSLPSFSVLKTLSLLSVKYPDDEFVKRFFSRCHVLEDLVVEQCLDDNVTIFTVKVPSLKSAFLSKSRCRHITNEDVFVIDAPTLKVLSVFNDRGGFCIVENRMPNIVHADVVVDHCPIEILSAITSVKRLYLCSSHSKDATVDSVFHRLVHLEICTCETEWLNLLMFVLTNSPNLKSLKLKLPHILRDEEPRPCWNEPDSVPECLLSSLDTFEWVKYEGTEVEKEVVAFILRNGSCLKKVTISSKTTDANKKLEMLKELSLSFRRSPTCQLIFV